MSRTVKTIDLPPPGSGRRRPKRNHGPWLVISVLALIGGVTAGIWYGKADPDPIAEEMVRGPGGVSSLKVQRDLESARVAVESGDWRVAEGLYQSVLEREPENAESLAALTIIRKHRQEAIGNLVILSEPEGAIVTIPGREPVQTPAEIRELPAGEMELRIEKRGFEPVIRKVAVVERQTTQLPKIALKPSRGSLKMVSKPEGASYKLFRYTAAGKEDWIEQGSTPAAIDSLDSGHYEVVMSFEGWPDYRESVTVEPNRKSSVSAVFAKGGINIVSDPVGAEVWTSSGRDAMEKRGVTPLTLSDLPPGRHQLEVRYRDWSPIRRTVEVKGNATINLEFGWDRSVVTFRSDPEGAAIFHQNRRVGDSRSVTPFTWEIPEGDYLFEARRDGLMAVTLDAYVEGTQPREIAFQFDYGSVSIESTPSEAAVIANGVPIGRTPLLRKVVAPGNYSYEIRKEGYRDTTLTGLVEPGGQLAFNTRLVGVEKPAGSSNFSNGLRQKMIWFGNLGGWVAETEVTQEIYQRLMGANPSDFEDPKGPVDSVTWYDAMRFCNNLTLFEGGLGNLPEGYEYRLPTDAEWSRFAGTPSLNNAVTSAVKRIQAPSRVGSVAPNEYGLYDIRGNVAEWVQDWYSQQIVNRAEDAGSIARPEWVGTDRKVLRGGSWLRSSNVDLGIEYRRGARPSMKDANDVGFRVVLMPK